MGAKKVAAVGYGVVAVVERVGQGHRDLRRRRAGPRGRVPEQHARVRRHRRRTRGARHQELGRRRPLPAARLRHELRDRAGSAAERREDEGQHPRHRLQPGPPRPADRQDHHAQRRDVQRRTGRSSSAARPSRRSSRPQEVRRPHRRARLRHVHRLHHLRHGHPGAARTPGRPRPARASSTASARPTAASTTAPASCASRSTSATRTSASSPTTAAPGSSASKDGKFKVLNGGKPVTGKLVGDPDLIKQYESNGGTGVTTTTAAPAS